MATVDVDAVPLSAFALVDALEPSRISAWHAHRKNQLLYAPRGSMHFEVRGVGCRRAQWMLPPQRAAWIPAHVEHRVRVAAKAELCTVYLDPDPRPDENTDAVVFGVSPLARAMLIEAARWGPTLVALPDVGAKFFTALAALASEWRTNALPFCLPTAETPELARAMRFALDHLTEPPSIDAAAKHAGLSARTLERRFASEAKTSWRKFVHSARMMRALELLAVPERRVTDVAIDLGFESFGAFSTAFQRFTGETPSAYRKRLAGG